MTGRTRAGFLAGVVALIVLAVLVALLARPSDRDDGSGGTGASAPAFSVDPGASGRPVTPTPNNLAPGSTAEERLSLFSFTGVCQGGRPRPVPRAARVSASGPHPLVVHVNGLLHQFADSGGYDHVDPFTPPPEQVQLVACAEYQERGKLLKKCRYTSSGVLRRTISHYEGRYRMRVHEARTGRLVGAHGMAGQDSVMCTGFVEEGPDSVVIETPDDVSLRAFLRPYARGERP